MQLQAQSNDAFDTFKDEYLMVIAKRSTFILLRFADGFTSTHSVEKLIYVLEMYEVLSSVVPSLILVFTGQRKELVSRQVEVVLAKLESVLKVMVATKIWTSISSGTQTTTQGVGTGIHPLTQDATRARQRRCYQLGRSQKGFSPELTIPVVWVVRAAGVLVGYGGHHLLFISVVGGGCGLCRKRKKKGVYEHMSNGGGGGSELPSPRRMLSRALTRYYPNLL
jgi:hypothetical protein